MPRLPRIITIDGEAHTGKSLAALKLATALDLYLLNTGAMYRSVAHLFGEVGVDIFDEANRESEAVRALIEPWVFALDGQDVHVNGRAMPPTIFDEPMNALSSAVSKWGVVRRKLQAEQRRIAAPHPHVVCEGRDQGTVVFPHAEVKFYFVAHYGVQAERAARKKRELTPHVPIDLAALRLSVEQRDLGDKSRGIDPLRKADDALEIDTSSMTPDEVLARLLKEVAAWQSLTT